MKYWRTNGRTTLKNHVLIYDADCPLCRLYTGAFIRTRMLDKNGRQNFCSRPSTAYPPIDRARARDEIALVDTRTGHITYGIDSLFKILAHRFPLLKRLFHWSPFHYAMSKLYSFVSFNRKVIAPANIFELPGSCNPSFSLPYRWSYIVVSWMFTSYILSRFAAKLEPVVPPTHFIREWLICGGQIIFQTIVVSLMRKDRLVHYLGNMMTVSNMGALLLLPALTLPLAYPLFYLVWFAGVVTFMLYEHHRRTHILELPIWASLSWVFYRLVILLLIVL